MLLINITIFLTASFPSLKNFNFFIFLILRLISMKLGNETVIWIVNISKREKECFYMKELIPTLRTDQFNPKEWGERKW